MLADDFEIFVQFHMDTQQKNLVTQKDGWCEDNVRSMAKNRQLLHALGPDAALAYSQTIVSVTIAPDKSSAVVEIRSMLQLPGVRMTSRYQDTVTRQQWRTRIQHSEGAAWIGLSYR